MGVGANVSESMDVGVGIISNQFDNPYDQALKQGHNYVITVLLTLHSMSLGMIMMMP